MSANALLSKELGFSLLSFLSHHSVLHALSRQLLSSVKPTRMMSLLIYQIPGIPGVSFTRNVAVLKSILAFGFGEGVVTLGLKAFKNSKVITE